jgi:hypothetical protein
MRISPNSPNQRKEGRKEGGRKEGGKEGRREGRNEDGPLLPSFHLFSRLNPIFNRLQCIDL